MLQNIEYMKQNCYRYLKLPFTADKPQFSKTNYLCYESGIGYLIKKKELSKHKTVLRFIESIDNITVYFVVYLKTGKNTFMRIHNDMPMLDEKTHGEGTSLNFNYGDNSSCLQFFDIKDYKDINIKVFDQSIVKPDAEAFTKKEDNLYYNDFLKHTYQSVDENKCNFICESKYDTQHPTLVNLGRFHRGYNLKGVTDRYVVQYQLSYKNNVSSDNKIVFKPVAFNDACDLLKDYIIDLT